MYRNGRNSRCYAVDVKAMRISRYKFGRNYMNAYHSHFPISPPEEDLDARLALYSLRRYQPISMVANPWGALLMTISSYLHESTLFVSDTKPRQEYICYTQASRGIELLLTTHRLIAETRKLVEMYPNGLE